MRTSQNKKALSRAMREKLAVTGAVILLALFALIYRLFSIQHNYSDEYNRRILSQQRYDSREIPYRRGDITDRNGTFLATSTKVFNLILDPSQINASQEDYLEPTLSLLNEVFGYDTAELRNIIIEKSDSQYIRYDKELSYDDKEKFEERKEEINTAYKKAGDTKRVYGIWFEDSYKRYYPNDSVACNVIGFSISDGHEGSGGIEQYYNSELIGISGREYGYLNDDSTLERIIKPAEDGNTIVSTIDVNIQKIVEKYIEQFNQETGSKTTAVIVMNPNNGEILAMAGNHPYDLNHPRDVSRYYSDEELENLTDKELSDVWNTIWRNFCISDTYEPGSTSKIFTVSAALEEGSIQGNESYECDGVQEVSGWPIKCNKVTGHGILTVTESLMQSCNDCMMQIVAGLGKERFCKCMNSFGFGVRTGIDLPGEADTSKLVYKPEQMVASDLATNSFGQNYNCTMIQMAAAYCSVINGGSYYEPHVVKQILNSSGSVISEYGAKLVKETVSAKTSEFIRNALERTVSEGTGSAARIEGYRVAGKTGTAEKYPRGNGNYLVSFSGFAPADDPQVLCYVIVDEPAVEDQPHSTFASGIFFNIMREVLPYMNIFREQDDEFYSDDIYAVTGLEETVEREPAASESRQEQSAPEKEKEKKENPAKEEQTVSGTEKKKDQKKDSSDAGNTGEGKKTYDHEEAVEEQNHSPEEAAQELPGAPPVTEETIAPFPGSFSE